MADAISSWKQVLASSIDDLRKYSITTNLENHFWFHVPILLRKSLHKRWSNGFRIEDYFLICSLFLLHNLSCPIYSFSMQEHTREWGQPTERYSAYFLSWKQYKKRDLKNRGRVNLMFWCRPPIRAKRQLIMVKWWTCQQKFEFTLHVLYVIRRRNCSKTDAGITHRRVGPFLWFLPNLATEWCQAVCSAISFRKRPHVISWETWMPNCGIRSLTMTLIPLEMASSVRCRSIENDDYTVILRPWAHAWTQHY